VQAEDQPAGAVETTSAEAGHHGAATPSATASAAVVQPGARQSMKK